MSYYTNSPIIYASIAQTSGMPSNTFAYAWSFDDGSTGNVASLSHSWSSPGNHVATVVATDTALGLSASATKSIYVVDYIPSWSKGGDIPSIASGVIYGIAYGNGVYVALIYNNSDGFTYVSRSSDLLTWTVPIAPFPSTRMRDITFGNGIFVIVGDGSSYTSTTGQVNYSSDGITWSRSNSSTAPTNAWQKVIYGGGVFVATSNNGVFMKSIDAITWTTVVVPNRYWTSIAYGNGKFVAISSTLGTIGQVIASPDGSIWTSQNTSSDQAWSDIAYGNNMYIAVGGSGSISSPDAVTWGPFTGGAYVFIACGNGKFVTVSNSGGYASKHSADGSIWTLDSTWPTTMNPSSALSKARFLNGLFVVGAVSTSTSLLCFAYA